MKKFADWRKSQNIDEFKLEELNREDFLKVCLEYFKSTLCGEMKTLHQFKEQNLVEAVETSRYSIDVNYRTTGDEALEGFAKICLGYISASMKNHGFHTKHVFSEKPLRLLVSSRNWDDGEWTGCVTWNPEHKCFIISKGFYNRDRQTISIQQSSKCSGNSASEITKELINTMHHLKGQPDRHIEKLKPVPLKRGPKR
jgi:hypothetical protein